MTSQAFVVKEPERLVTSVVNVRDHYRTVRVRSELIPDKLGHRNVHRVGAQARGRDHGIVTVVFVSSTVQLVCATAREQDHRGRLVKARVGAHGFNSKLLDSFNPRPHADDPAAETVDLRDAVQVDIQRADFHPVDAGSSRAALHARGQAEKQADVAPVQRKVADLAGLFHITHGTLRRLDGRHGPGDFQNRRGAAQLESRIDHHILTHRESQGTFPGVETLSLGGQLVRTGRQLAEEIRTERRSLGAAGEPCFCMGDGHFRAGHQSLGWVSHRARDRPQPCLRRSEGQC